MVKMRSGRMPSGSFIPGFKVSCIQNEKELFIL